MTGQGLVRTPRSVTLQIAPREPYSGRNVSGLGIDLARTARQCSFGERKSDAAIGAGD